MQSFWDIYDTLGLHNTPEPKSPGTGAISSILGDEVITPKQPEYSKGPATYEYKYSPEGETFYTPTAYPPTAPSTSSIIGNMARLFGGQDVTQVQENGEPDTSQTQAQQQPKQLGRVFPQPGETDEFKIPWGPLFGAGTGVITGLLQQQPFQNIAAGPVGAAFGMIPPLIGGDTGRYLGPLAGGVGKTAQALTRGIPFKDAANIGAGGLLSGLINLGLGEANLPPGFNFALGELGLIPQVVNAITGLTGLGIPALPTTGLLDMALQGIGSIATGIGTPIAASTLQAISSVLPGVGIIAGGILSAIMDNQAKVKEAKANRKVRTQVVTNYDNNKPAYDNLYNFFTSNLPKNLQESLSTYGYSDLTKILGPELMSFFTPHQTLTTFPGEGHEWYNAKPNGPFGRFERVGPLWMSSSSALQAFADRNIENKYIEGALEFAQKYGSDPRLGQGTAPLEQMDMLSKEKPLLEYADPNSPKYVGDGKINVVYKTVGDWENPQPTNEVAYYEIPGVGRVTSLYTASPYEQFMNTIWPMIGYDNTPITPEGWDKLTTMWSTFTGRPKEEADPFQFRAGLRRWQDEEGKKAAAQLEDEQARRFAESGAMF